MTTKEWYHKEYVENKRTIDDIAAELKVCRTTVRLRLIKHGIIIRTPAESRLRSINIPQLNKEWLQKEYIAKKRSLRKIGKELNVSATTIKFYIKLYDIKMRKANDYNAINETRLNEKWLREEYINKNRTLDDIAVELGIGHSSMNLYMKKFNIKSRKPYNYGKSISTPHSNLLIPLLDKYNINHTTSHIINKLPGQPSQSRGYEIDEYLPEAKIFLELYGDYWHNLPRQVESDKRKIDLLQRNFPDHKTVVIWEHQLKTGEAEITIQNIIAA